MYDTFIAHRNEISGDIQTIKEHSEEVAKLANSFAITEMKDIVYLAGLFHDIGKYQFSFQQRIRGKDIRIEHSICGAQAIRNIYGNTPASLLVQYIIAGHHGGIPDGGTAIDVDKTLKGRLKKQTEDYSKYIEDLDFADARLDNEKFIKLLSEDCSNDFSKIIDKYAFLTRYAYSCLTDADSLDTESFCNNSRREKLYADFQKCLNKIDAKLDSFICETELQRTRRSIQNQVFSKTNIDAEIYLMNMPTGSGKTIASVKFALEQAMKDGKRIIYVIPYNSIIDQTAQEFENTFGEDLQLLRHQSTFSYDDDTEYSNRAKLACENWDAPFIITTAVQFFESIHANKRSKLRKMHNLANSIIVFDEAHLMPLKYLQACLQAIVYTTRYLNSKAIFLTATMPDFEKLLYDYVFPDTKICNLVEDKSDFGIFKKCTYSNIGEIDISDFTKITSNNPSNLIIVNKRKIARDIYEILPGKKYHLSTYMTPFDRKRILRDIRSSLADVKEKIESGEFTEDDQVNIISTSLIEAGVDIDVHTVYRELTGLDSILQAGGRCNREGKRESGDVFIFEINEPIKKVAIDERAIITKDILSRNDDVSNDKYIKEYYERWLNIKEDSIKAHTISNVAHSFDSIPFRTYSEEFEIVDSEQASLVIPQTEEVKRIIDNIDYIGLGVMRKLQEYTCSVYKWELEKLIEHHVAGVSDTGIYYLNSIDYYDENIGILFEAPDYFI